MAASTDGEDDASAVEEEDLYNVLGLTQQCTMEDIKKRYKHLASVFHPDKHATKGEETVAEASDQFAKIQEAYEILQDDQKRAIYDLYGMDGVRAGSSIVGRNPQEFREELEREKRRQEEMEHERKLQWKSTYLFGVNAMSHSNNRGLNNIAINSTVTAPLSNKDILTLGGSAATRMGMGGGTFLVAYRKILSSQLNIESSIQAGLKSVLLIMAECELSSYDSMTVTSVFDMKALALGIGPNVTSAFTRHIGSNTTATTSLSMGPDHGVGFEIKRAVDTNSAAFNVQLGAGASLSGSLNLSKKFTKKSISRVQVKLGGHGGLEVETSMLKQFDSSLVAGFGGAISLAGASFKLKFQRSGAKFIVPIQLYSRPTIQAAFSVFLFPPMLYFSSMRYIIQPLLRREKRKVLEAKKEKIRSAIKKALKQQEILKAAAARKAQKERSVNGLEIVRAFYGDADRVHQYLSGQDRGVGDVENVNGEPSEAISGLIEVTIPLQFICETSCIRIVATGRRASLIGFCDPVPDQPKVLYVEFRRNGSNVIETLEFSDSEEVVIPPEDGKKSPLDDDL